MSAEPLERHLQPFQLTAFRPGQRDVIAAVLAGRDCLCIMPTGGGKSLCYQLPAVAREGLTLVVSPLIALMKDQVDGLTRLGIAATYINSSLAPAEAFQRIDQMAAGRYDLVYIAPERLRSSLFLEKLRETKLQLLAVDEAHCISQWGHDFRPDYARLGRFREKLGYPQTIALTATATQGVQADVAQQLRLREPQVFITGFARPNLSFEVQPVLSEIDHERSLTGFLQTTPGAGIIYCATRKRCEELAPIASAVSGRRADLYHAGLEPDVRRRVQDDFRSGKTPIIVATNAFGMGIDKPDLRFVVHYNIPGTLEAYYQEAGRAGRDGDPARCVLFYSQRDRRIQEFFIDSAYPEPEIVEQVYNFLRQIDHDPIELTLDEIRETLGLNIRSEGVAACEKLLAGVGALERLDSRQNMAAVRIDSDLPSLVDLLPKQAKMQRRVLQAVEREVGGRRFERVYFPPRKIASMAELDPAAISQALKELSKLQAFDYVPPFRGRAVHMLIKDKEFDDLGIDFDEQQRHKADEYAKLDRMIAYAEAHSCRQLEILDYFGDPNREACGSCDNCLVRAKNQAGGASPASGRRQLPDDSESPGPRHREADASRSPAVVEAVRIVLSGAARLKGRYGKQMLAKMLVGSQAKEVTKFRLNQLSTFGL
ncbi:MAG TPA: ATP-dependent DNA helicase RecQ, partial [Pirellulaceae bacterium]|nr:ATP-dependent DNA helicase RecQ [Pirellulaceae bacterium]